MNTEYNEVKDDLVQVKTGMGKLDGALRVCEHNSGKAMAIARSLQRGQTKLANELEKLYQRTTPNSSVASLEPHSVSDTILARGARHINRNVATLKAPSTQKRDPHFDRPGIIDSQITMSHLVDDEKILPGSCAILIPEPARVIQQKAKTLATPSLTPGRRLRSRTRAALGVSLENRSATKPPFASSMPPASMQSNNPSMPMEVTQIETHIPAAVTRSAAETQTPDDSSSSIPSMSSLLAPDGQCMTQNQCLLGSAGSKIVSNNTPPPVAPVPMSVQGRKRKLDDVALDETQSEPPRSDVQTITAASVKPAVPYSLQMGKNGKPVVLTMPYKQNKRQNMDDL